MIGAYEVATLMPESPMLRSLAVVSSAYRTVPIKADVAALAEVDAGLLGALALDGSMRWCCAIWNACTPGLAARRADGV